MFYATLNPLPDDAVPRRRLALASMTAAAALSTLFFCIRPLQSTTLATAFSDLHSPAAAAAVRSFAIVILSFGTGIAVTYALGRSIPRTAMHAAALGVYSVDQLIRSTRIAVVRKSGAAVLATVTPGRKRTKGR